MCLDRYTTNLQLELYYTLSLASSTSLADRGMIRASSDNVNSIVGSCHIDSCLAIGTCL